MLSFEWTLAKRRAFSSEIDRRKQKVLAIKFFMILLHLFGLLLPSRGLKWQHTKIMGSFPGILLGKNTYAF